MGKKVYRVKKGDDFIKISRKLYGDSSYVMDLLRANPGFHRVGPGMVLRLPKTDPRITRDRKMKRRRKLYGEPSEETKDPLAETPEEQYERITGLMEDPEEIMGYDPGADLSQDTGMGTGQSAPTVKPPATPDDEDDGLTSPENLQMFADTVVEAIHKMGLDVDTMLDELGLGVIRDAPQTQSQQAGETGKTSGRGSKGLERPAELRPAVDEWDESSSEIPQTTPQQPDETQQPASTISRRKRKLNLKRKMSEWILRTKGSSLYPKKKGEGFRQINW
jgi:nucleoid-associated protein YgaU